jgi:hypothetical protein
MGRPGSGVDLPRRILRLTRPGANRPPREAQRPPREAKTPDPGRSVRLGSGVRQDSGRFVRLARRVSPDPGRIAHAARRVAQDPGPGAEFVRGTSERFWLGLQVDFDLEAAKRALAGRLEREVRPAASAA